MTKKKKFGKVLLILFLLLLCLAGIAIMTYPIWSEIYMEKVHSSVQADYQQKVEQQAQGEDLSEIRKGAEIYNEKLFNGEIDLLHPEQSGYFETLVVPGTEVMAYITIPRLSLSLSVYHGIGTDVLDKGCGHMPQSSFPIGGENTRSVISAHTGMASSPMFSNLEMLEPGDIFQIKVLNEVLTYEIQSQEDIIVVLPDDVSTAYIVPGEDLCTLVTCTPFGINTHRLLVTGHRIPNPEIEEIEQIQEIAENTETPSVYRENYYKAIQLGAVISLAVLFVGITVLVIVRKRQNRGSNGKR